MTKVSNQRPLCPEQAQTGAVSHSEFAKPQNTTFFCGLILKAAQSRIRWKRAATLDGRRVNVFEFRVPQSSGYALVGSKGPVKVAFEGSVYADPQTGTVVQIELKCTDIPTSSEYRALSLTLDYKPAKIAGREHLLPSGFLLHYQTTRNGAMIDAEFKSCRQFSADSTVTFDDDSGTTRGADARPAPAPELPPVPEAKAPVPDQPAAETHRARAGQRLPCAHRPRDHLPRVQPGWSSWCDRAGRTARHADLLRRAPDLRKRRSSKESVCFRRRCTEPFVISSSFDAATRTQGTFTIASAVAGRR